MTTRVGARRRSSAPVSLQPSTLLAISLLAATLFGVFVGIRYTGSERRFLLYYFVPIAVPFVAYVLERVETRATYRVIQWAIEAPILALSLARAILPVPFFSGHALYLTYALITTRSRVARVTAALVFIEVVYLKLLWHDRTLFGGIVLGTVSGLCFRYLGGTARSDDVASWKVSRELP